MTPIEFEKEMKKLQKKYKHDTEELHWSMDDLMMKVLIDLGYDKGVNIFTQQEKWYS